MTKRVYVAASSNQLERAGAVMDALEARGYEIAHDWVKIIIERGAANPTDASEAQCALWAAEDLIGVRSADVLFLLMPAEGGLGAFWETGYAQALGKPLVISGAYERTIFSAGHACYAYDGLAIEAEFPHVQ